MNFDCKTTFLRDTFSILNIKLKKNLIVIYLSFIFFDVLVTSLSGVFMYVEI